MIIWSLEVTHTQSGSGEVEAQVDLDGGTIIMETHEEPTDGEDYTQKGGHAIRTLTAATHTVDIDYRVASGSGTAKIKRAIVSTWRVT